MAYYTLNEYEPIEYKLILKEKFDFIGILNLDVQTGFGSDFLKYFSGIDFFQITDPVKTKATGSGSAASCPQQAFFPFRASEGHGQTVVTVIHG